LDNHFLAFHRIIEYCRIAYREILRLRAMLMNQDTVYRRARSACRDISLSQKPARPILSAGNFVDQRERHPENKRLPMSRFREATIPKTRAA